MYVYLIFLLTIATAIARDIKPEPQYRNASLYDWDLRHEMILERHRTIKPDIVFIGDSITHFWGGEPSDVPGVANQAWAAMVGTNTASNLGFGWDFIDNAYYRIQKGELDGTSPKVIVVLLGVNNLGTRGDSPKDCAALMRDFLSLLRKRTPQTKILLVGILPSCDAKANKDILATDCLYSALADKKNNIYYADFTTKFLPNGAAAVPRDLMVGVHPNSKGYELLGQCIRSKFVELGVCAAADRP